MAGTARLWPLRSPGCPRPRHPRYPMVGASLWKSYGRTCTLVLIGPPIPQGMSSFRSAEALRFCWWIFGHVLCMLLAIFAALIPFASSPPCSERPLSPWQISRHLFRPKKQRTWKNAVSTTCWSYMTNARARSVAGVTRRRSKSISSRCCAPWKSIWCIRRVCCAVDSSHGRGKSVIRE